MIYIVSENSISESYFAVSSYLGKCSYYATSPESALQNLLTTSNYEDSPDLLKFEQNVLASPAYTVLATYSLEDYPEYFI